jgi:hypothetical protein
MLQLFQNDGRLLVTRPTTGTLTLVRMCTWSFQIKVSRTIRRIVFDLITIKKKYMDNHHHVYLVMHLCRIKLQEIHFLFCRFVTKGNLDHLTLELWVKNECTRLIFFHLFRSSNGYPLIHWTKTIVPTATDSLSPQLQV